MCVRVRTLMPTYSGLVRKVSSCSAVRPPKHWMMWYSWSISDSPANNGSPVASSASMQPIAHTSTALPYDCARA